MMLTILGGRAGPVDALAGGNHPVLSSGGGSGPPGAGTIYLEGGADVLEALQAPGFFRLHVLSPSALKAGWPTAWARGRASALMSGKLLSLPGPPEESSRSCLWPGLGPAGKVTIMLPAKPPAGMSGQLLSVATPEESSRSCSIMAR